MFGLLSVLEFRVNPAGKRVERRAVADLHFQVSSSGDFGERPVSLGYGERGLQCGLSVDYVAAVVPDGRE